MMKNAVWKRAASVLLSLVLASGMLVVSPTTARAEDEILAVSTEGTEDEGAPPVESEESDGLNEPLDALAVYPSGEATWTVTENTLSGRPSVRCLPCRPLCLLETSP